jgi:hypothetical protein
LIGGLTQYGLEFVIGNLRDADEAEVRATIYQGSAEKTAKLIASIPGPKWEARTERDAEPAAVGGFVPVWPGMGSGWMWGTGRWDEVVIEVTRAMKQHILPTLDARGVHRIECRAMASNTASIRWLKMLGFKREAVTAQFGQGREDFVLCARVTGDAARVH